MHFAYSHIAVTGVFHHIFACIDWFWVDVAVRKTLSGSMVSVIILSTLSRAKRIFLFYLLHSLVLFGLPIAIWIALFLCDRDPVIKELK